METRHLIDAIVGQTTLLIAQLATTGGVRAPLAHIADEVFLELAREIEQQGVSRNVVADMFGMALRTYQKKVNRVRESVTHKERTLWEGVLAFVRAQGGATRSQVISKFAHDDERHVIAVLGDLVVSGLLYGTGRGKHAAYGPVPERELRALVEEQGVDALAHMVWLEIADNPEISKSELLKRFSHRQALLDEAIGSLLADGRVQCDLDTRLPHYRTTRVLIPSDSEAGWETAVFDHFRAVCNAIAAKLRSGGPSSDQGALIGGTTLRFEIHPGHPNERAVLALLSRTREGASELWSQVASYNKEHPVPQNHQQVTFYFGQNIIQSLNEEEGNP